MLSVMDTPTDRKKGLVFLKKRQKLLDQLWKGIGFKISPPSLCLNPDNRSIRNVSINSLLGRGQELYSIWFLVLCVVLFILYFSVQGSEFCVISFFFIHSSGWTWRYSLYCIYIVFVQFLTLNCSISQGEPAVCSRLAPSSNFFGNVLV